MTARINPNTWEVDMPVRYNALINEKIVKLQKLTSAFTFLTSQRNHMDADDYDTLYRNLSLQIEDEKAYLQQWAKDYRLGRI